MKQGNFIIISSMISSLYIIIDLILSPVAYVFYLEELFIYHKEFLSVQPMFPPKPFDCPGGLVAFRFFFTA